MPCLGDWWDEPSDGVKIRVEPDRQTGERTVTLRATGLSAVEALQLIASTIPGLIDDMEASD